MIRLRVLMIWLGCAFLLAACTNRPRQIVINPNFEDGKIYRFEIERSKTVSDYKNAGGLVSVTDIALQVKKQKVTEYDFTYGATHLGGGLALNTSDTFQRSIDFRKGIIIRMSIDENGKLQEILNFDTVETQLKSSLRSTYKVLGGVTDEIVDKTFEAMDFSLENPEAMLQIYFPEIPLLTGLTNDTLEVGNAYTKNFIVSIPFTDKFKYHETKYIEKNDAALKYGIIDMTILQVPEDGQVKNFVETILKSQNMDSLKGNIENYSSWTISRYSYDFKNQKLITAISEHMKKVDTIQEVETTRVIAKY